MICKDRHMLVRTICPLIVSMIISVPALAAQVTLVDPTATFCQSSGGSYPISATIDGSFNPATGWAIYGGVGSDQTAVYKTATDINATGGTELSFDLHMVFFNQHSIGKFRLSATTSNRGSFGLGAECADANPGGSAVWTVLDPLSVHSANGQTLTVQPDGSILASGYLPDTDVVTVRAQTQLQGITGFRLETLTDGSLPYNGPGRYPGNGNFVLTELVANAQYSNVAVPALSAWALAQMSLLLGSAGFLWLRRSRYR